MDELGEIGGRVEGDVHPITLPQRSSDRPSSRVRS